MHDSFKRMHYTLQSLRKITFRSQIYPSHLKLMYLVRPLGIERFRLLFLISYLDSRFVGYCFLYIFYGFIDAMWQTYAYWLMGALSNDPRKLAYFAGFYKGIQSAGAAVVWRLDAVKTSFEAL